MVRYKDTTIRYYTTEPEQGCRKEVMISRQEIGGVT